MDKFEITITIRSIKKPEINFSTFSGSSPNLIFKVGDKMQIVNHLWNEYGIIGEIIRIHQGYIFTTLEDERDKRIREVPRIYASLLLIK